MEGAFSNRHLDLAARDEESVIGWRYEPRIVFSGGRGARLVDVDGNEYYDCNAGMMCLVLGHAHPELVETIREQAERFVHQSSWFTNPWAIELAELVASTLPDGLEVTNYAVTGSEANEIAMRMALGVTGGFDICTVVRGLHGGSLAAESATSVGGARKRGLGPLSLPAVTNCIVPPFYYRAPVRDADAWDEISLQLTEELIEHTTSQEVGGILVEPMMVAGGMIVPSKRWMRGLREIADRWGALLIFDEAQLAPAKTGAMWGFEHYGVVPDVVTWAKGMSAGLPVCGTVTTREIAGARRRHQGPALGGHLLERSAARRGRAQAAPDRDSRRARRACGGARRDVAKRPRGPAAAPRVHRRRARCGLLPGARHRGRSRDPHAGPGNGRAHPLPRACRGPGDHLRQETTCGSRRP